MLENFKIILSSCGIQMKQSFARATFRFCVLAQPILYAIITYMMFRDSGQENFIAYVVLGTGLLSLWSSICFSSAGDIERERYMGTLEIITSTPAKFEVIMFGKIIGNTIWGIFSMIITFIFVTITFRVPVKIENPVIFFIIFILSMLSFIAISMLMAAFFTLSRNSRALMNCLEYPVFILCGIMFPINILPLWTRPISYILSPTWAVELLRSSVLGIKDINQFYTKTLILISITIIYFTAALKLFKKIDVETRIKATLGVY